MAQMVLFDVNVYVYAHREDSPHHGSIKAVVERHLSGAAPVGFSPLALSGFLRVVTHPRIFDPPTPLDTAIGFCRSITEASASVPVVPGDSHWAIFLHMIESARATGNFVPDAWFAALAVEHLDLDRLATLL